MTNAAQIKTPHGSLMPAPRDNARIIHESSEVSDEKLDILVSSIESKAGIRDIAIFPPPDPQAYLNQMGDLQKAKALIEEIDFRTLDVTQDGVMRREYTASSNGYSDYKLSNASNVIGRLPPALQERIALMTRLIKATEAFKKKKVAYFDRFASGESSHVIDDHNDGQTTVHLSGSGAGLEGRTQKMEWFQMNVGDVVIFDGFFMHRGPSNSRQTGGHSSLNIQASFEVPGRKLHQSRLIRSLKML